MYPYLFHSEYLPSYVVLICIGVLVALIMFRVICFKLSLPEKSFRFYGIIIVVSIGLGFVFARLFQMLYNYLETGDIGTGITFLGGLIGGVATFILLFALFGKNYRKDFFKVVNIAMPCIAIGHFFGRIGCFLAGCCYGKKTDFLGVRFVEKITTTGEWIYGDPRVPTQLIEALLLIMLGITLLIVIFSFKKSEYSAVIYLYTYSIFRFIIEFVRDDPRGAFLFGLSPSQIISIIMFIGAIALNIIVIRHNKKPEMEKPRM